MKTVPWRRRNITVAVCFSLALVAALYSWPSLDTGRLARIIPHHSGTRPSLPNSTSAKDDESEHEHVAPSSAPERPYLSSHPAGKTSRLHYLIPASKPNLHLCYNLASSAANRYPAPMLLGWGGIGVFNAALTHLAKLRAMERYFAQLDADEDEDLVLIVDGYDILLQLPPEIMIERYFEISGRADARLAERFNISVGEARDQGLRQTIFWGPDKVCWPIDDTAPRCWAAPPTGLPPNAFGPLTGTGEMLFADPRWLNSGTVIGPVGDMRRYIAATMDEIQATHDPNFELSESDQYYLANVWGRQEYWRSVKAGNGSAVDGGPVDRQIPEKRTEDQETELHASIEYESLLFQTKAGNEPFFGHLQFNNSGPGITASMNVDMFGQGKDFVPYDIDMPENVHTAMLKLYDAIAESHPGLLGKEWIRQVGFGVNFVTRHIYALWHCTGGKEFIGLEYRNLWFYPYVRQLMVAAVEASHRDDLISSEPIGGRMWAHKMSYPDNKKLGDDLGGSWSDVGGGKFVSWEAICGEYEAVLFAGEEGLRR